MEKNETLFEQIRFWVIAPVLGLVLITLMPLMIIGMFIVHYYYKLTGQNEPK